MTQSRLGSLIESLANVAIGYGVAVASQCAIFPLFGIHIPLSDNHWAVLHGDFDRSKLPRPKAVQSVERVLSSRRGLGSAA